MTDVSTTSTAEWWSYSESNGAFHSTRLNSGWKFRKFYVPNGTAHSGCTHPTEPSACLFIVLVSRREQQLGHFGPTDQNDQVCQNGPPSKLVPNIPVGPNLIGQSSRDVVGHQSVKP